MNLQKATYWLVIILSSMLLVRVSFAPKKQVAPEWGIKVSEETYLDLFEKDLFLRNGNTTYSINKDDGTVSFSNQVIDLPTKQNLRSTTRLNKEIISEHTYNSDTYQFVEIWKGVSSCIESQHRYEIKKETKEGETVKFLIGKNSDYFIADFEWIDNELYIVKEPSDGGDALFLEKYIL